MIQRSLLMVLASIASITIACAQQYKNVSPKEAKAMIDKGNIVLVDVRTPQEWNSGHLSGAVLVDFYDANFETNIKKVAKDKKVVVYCARGRRSASAAEKMMAWGWKDVSSMSGGYEAWTGADLPTTTK